MMPEHSRPGVLLTGACGRVGRAIYVALAKKYHVIGFDRQACSAVEYVGDIRDKALLEQAMKKADIVVHTASLHAPHVGLVPDEDFWEINVQATRTLLELAQAHEIDHIVYTSTTALYGFAARKEKEAAWINEQVIPSPRTIYHETKIAAENLLEAFSLESDIPVTVLQMSRCFPEPADQMAVYRLYRGIDARDVGSAHALAINKRLHGFRRYILSGTTPFKEEYCTRLYADAAGLIRELVPNLAAEYDKRGWNLPASIDRVYDSRLAKEELGWFPRYGYPAVLEMLDNEISEVLPVLSSNW